MQPRCLVLCYPWRLILYGPLTKITVLFITLHCTSEKLLEIMQHHVLSTYPAAIRGAIRGGKPGI